MEHLLCVRSCSEPQGFRLCLPMAHVPVATDKRPLISPNDKPTEVTIGIKTIVEHSGTNAVCLDKPCSQS